MQEAFLLLVICFVLPLPKSYFLFCFFVKVQLSKEEKEPKCRGGIDGNK
jgi:hypothetical protein